MRLSRIIVCPLAIAAALAVAHPAQARKSSHEKRSERVSRIPDGQLHIIVSLASQRVAVYSNGVLAMRSNVATGVPGHATPTGVFSVIGKERFHESNIYSGAPMPFMQRITWSGIALHQGVVPGGRPASHGCIRLPSDFAQLMYRTTKLGARVIIARDDVAPVAFSQPFPFGMKPVPALAEGERAAPTKTAEAAPVVATDAPPAAAIESDAAIRDMDAQETKKELAQARGPVSVFISAKEKKIFVRRQFLPVFEAPVTIGDAERPLGTHVFTAVATGEPDKLRWLAVTVPDDIRPKASKKTTRKNADLKPEDEKPVSTAAEALMRIDIPAETRARIDEMMGPGASVIVSDRGLGDETGEGTDFVVLTR